MGGQYFSNNSEIQIFVKYRIWIITTPLKWFILISQRAYTHKNGVEFHCCHEKVSSIVVQRWVTPPNHSLKNLHKRAHTDIHIFMYIQLYRKMSEFPFLKMQYLNQPTYLWTQDLIISIKVQNENLNQTHFDKLDYSVLHVNWRKISIDKVRMKWPLSRSWVKIKKKSSRSQLIL